MYVCLVVYIDMNTYQINKSYNQMNILVYTNILYLFII
jgi:hypothetical protein